MLMVNITLSDCAQIKINKQIGTDKNGKLASYNTFTL